MSMLTCGPYFTWPAHSTPYHGHCCCPPLPTCTWYLTYPMLVVPKNPQVHKDGSPDPENCLLALGIVADVISGHSYCQARNVHCDYFITSTHLHTQWQQKKTTNMKFYSLAPPAPASGLFGHWSPFLSPLGQLCLFFFLLLAEKQNIHTITKGHTHIENYTVIS